MNRYELTIVDTNGDKHVYEIEYEGSCRPLPSFTDQTVFWSGRGQTIGFNKNCLHHYNIERIEETSDGSAPAAPR